MKYNILRAEQMTVLGEKVLEVTFEILDGEEVVIERILSFPADTSAKEIKEELKRYVTTYNGELKQAKTQAVLDQQDEAAALTIKELQK